MSHFFLTKNWFGFRSGQKLAVFVKMLTEKVKLHPQINTYTINLLVFFYFQSKRYLPPVVDLIEPPTLKCKIFNFIFTLRPAWEPTEKLSTSALWPALRFLSKQNWSFASVYRLAARVYDKNDGRVEHANDENVSRTVRWLHGFLCTSRRFRIECPVSIHRIDNS